MASTHLSLPIRLPFEERQRHARVDSLTTSVANTLIGQYWTPEHLTEIGDSAYQAWKYFDESEAFVDVDLYLPSRYKRCVMQKVGETLRSHADKREAFQTILPLLPDHKIRRIHTRRIKERLWDAEEYIKSGYVEVLIGQLNSYYDKHGRFPESYLEIQECPTYSKGVLPYSADDGPTSGQAVKYEYDEEAETLTVKIKTPDTVEPETRGEWTWTAHKLGGYDAFHELLLEPQRQLWNKEVSRPPLSTPHRRKSGTITTNSRSPWKSNTKRNQTTLKPSWRLTVVSEKMRLLSL